MRLFTSDNKKPQKPKLAKKPKTVPWQERYFEPHGTADSLPTAPVDASKTSAAKQANRDQYDRIARGERGGYIEAFRDREYSQEIDAKARVEAHKARMRGTRN